PVPRRRLTSRSFSARATRSPSSTTGPQRSPESVGASHPGSPVGCATARYPRVEISTRPSGTTTSSPSGCSGNGTDHTTRSSSAGAVVGSTVDTTRSLRGWIRARAGADPLDPDHVVVGTDVGHSSGPDVGDTATPQLG